MHGCEIVHKDPIWLLFKGLQSEMHGVCQGTGNAGHADVMMLRTLS